MLALADTDSPTLSGDWFEDYAMVVDVNEYCEAQNQSCSIFAPAKINLFLELLGKRPDGFHEIETIMVPISLGDEIRVSARTDGHLNVHCQFASGVNPNADEIDVIRSKKNLAWRAADELRQFAERQGISNGAIEVLGADIEIYKRIPSQAGLGGASSDAAATLMAVNRVWNLDLAKRDLHEIAARLGSDIPYFLYQQFAKCTGRGEEISNYSQRMSIPVVICKPSFGLATVDVYRNAIISQNPISATDFENHWINGRLSDAARQTFNRLQASASKLTTTIQTMSYQFSQIGSLGHQMSGSGTSYFALFSNRRSAEIAAKKLKARLPECFIYSGRTLATRCFDID